MDKPVDMKLTKSDLKVGNETMPATLSKDGPKYPWGLEIRLDKISLDKLGMSEDLPDVGVLCQVTAVARVISVSESQRQEGEDCNVTIQIERMTLAVDDEEEAFERGVKKGRGRGEY